MVWVTNLNFIKLWLCETNIVWK